MVALAHVEATGIRKVARIGEIDRILGAHVTAAEGCLLKWNAVLMTPSNVDESPAIGAEQPFVGWEDHKVRVEPFHVHVQHAGAMRRVDEKDSALPAQRLSYS